MSGDDTTEQPSTESVSDREPGDASVTDTATDADETAGNESTSATDGWIGGRIMRRVNVPVIPLVLVLLLLMSGALAAWLYVKEYRPDEQTDAASAAAVTRAAQDGMIALLSYKSGTLDQDVTAAKSHLTGDFVNEYEKRVREVVAPAVRAKDVKTTAYVVGSGVSELHPNSAVILVYLNEATVSKDHPDQAMLASSILVSLTKVQGTWLITKFDPI
jgi:Mce-associated membrane protein